MATVENLLLSPGKKSRQRENPRQASPPPAGWTNLEKIFFRFFFLYFFIQAVPLDWKYYQHLFSIDWLNLHLRDIFNLSRYTPQFLAPAEPGSWGTGTFADWGVVGLLALAGAALWSYRDKNRLEYQQLFYWLRVAVRHRLAIGLFAYGFLKLFPMQAPLPSLSNLNTHYGDFHAWKLFSMSLGIAPGYESFLGLVEILAATLLLYRKTAFLGAFIILPFTGNVFVSNLAYEGGEYVYSLYLVLLAVFLLAYDLPRLYSLLVREHPTLPNRFHPAFSGWQQKARVGLKAAVIFFFVGLYGYKSFAAYHRDPYQFPQSPGLAQASGIYQVTEFRLNNKVLPYSATNPDRWQDVVFEEWATLSIRSPRPVRMEVANREEIYLNDEQRNYEDAGSIGRHYYGYRMDAATQVLYLQHKNKHHQTEKLKLHYERPSATRIILSGRNENQDPVYVVLDKIPKKYLLKEAAGRNRREALIL